MFGKTAKWMWLLYQTVSYATKDEWNTSDSDSLTMTAYENDPDMNYFCQRVVSSDDENYLDSDNGSDTDLDSSGPEGAYCVVSDDGSAADLNVDMISLWMAPWDAGGTFRIGFRPDMAIRRDRLRCVVQYFGGLAWTSVIDVYAGVSTAPVEIMVEDQKPDFLALGICEDSRGRGYGYSPGGCSRLYLLALLAVWGHCPHPTLTLLAGWPSVTGGPVGQPGTLPPSTFASAILVDPGGTFPSSDLAGMPDIPVRPVGIWGTFSSSDSDPTGQDGSHATGVPVGHLGTLPPTTSECGILVDPGGMFPSSGLARMRGPAAPVGSPVLRGPVGPAMSLDTLLPAVDVPGLYQIVLTVGLWPVVAVPLPAVWDPLFTLSPVEELKKTGAEVVGRRLAVRDGWSVPAVAGISAVIARAVMYAVLLNIGAPSDHDVGCPPWGGGLSS